MTVVAALDRQGVAYMLTGSFASSLQGEPRLSHDIDLVVDLPAAAIEPLVAEFPPPEFYLSRDAIRAALANRSMFNLLQTYEGDKIDFWLLTDDRFDRSRFARRRRVVVENQGIFVSSPEDTLLKKLSWAKECGGSEKQMQDAIGVFEVQFSVLDQEYLAEWIRALGIEDYWQALLARAQPE